MTATEGNIKTKPDWVDRLKAHLPERPLAFVVATFIGLTIGTMAALLKQSVAWISRLVISGTVASTYNLIFIALPIIGLLLTVAVCRFWFRRNLSHGVRQMQQQLRRGDARLPADGIYAPFVASSLTLGFGGSAGSEGPIACIGSALGSNLARWLRLPPHLMTLLLGVGAAAGIAGIFKAPLGGALFTIEVLGIGLSTLGVLLVVTASLVAGITAFLLGGNQVDVVMTGNAGFDLSLTGWVVLLGLACGLYSLYYSFIMKTIEHWLRLMRSPWVKAVIAGLLLGCLIFVFPALYGEGYQTLGRIINGDYAGLMAYGPFADMAADRWVLIVIALCTLMTKCFATSLTNSGGGVSGDFAPTLFAGVIAGLLFAEFLNACFGLSLPVPLFAYLGLAGVMAGAIRAPLMAIFLITEMTGSFNLILPVTLTAALSFFVVRLYTSDGFYDFRIDRPNGPASRAIRKREGNP